MSNMNEEKEKAWKEFNEPDFDKQMFYGGWDAGVKAERERKRIRSTFALEALEMLEENALDIRHPDVANCLKIIKECLKDKQE